jgi:FKBP-type peptidyl-prolyl cis-trans isomerase
MKNSIKILFVLLLAAGSMSCLKENPYDAYDADGIWEKEKPLLKEYVETTEGLEGAKLDTLTNIWYKIIKPGVGPDEEGFYKYKINSSGYVEAPLITVNYEGRLISTGVVFDKNEKAGGVEYPLGGVGLIDGWKIAFLPKTVKDNDGKVYKISALTGLTGLTELGLQKGSEIRVVIPSLYCYQDRDYLGIPANSPLDFTIKVLGLKAPTSNQ